MIFWRQRFGEDQRQGRPVIERFRDRPRAGRPPQFTPAQAVQITAVAWAQPAQLDLPLSRFSPGEIALWIKQADMVTTISVSPRWRLLHQDAMRPWYDRGWRFPRAPAVVAKARVIRDLYQRRWPGQPLGPHEYARSADAQSALHVLARPHPTLAPTPGQPGRYALEYVRNGTLAYLAAPDGGGGQAFGRIDATTGVAPFGRLVDLGMQCKPYATAERVFWIVDGGSSPHPRTAPARVQQAYPNIVGVHTPTHARRLNQIERSFSIVQRKALTPLDLPDRVAVGERILQFQERDHRTAKPFRWKFTRQNVQDRLQSLADTTSENL